MADSPILSRVALNVRTLRNQLGLSQEQLAERASLHRTYIAGIEAGGRNMTLKSMEKLAQALAVSLERLLAGGQERDILSPQIGAGTSVVDVLLVEDKPDDVTLTIQAFHEVHFANRVTVVKDGAEALEYLFCTDRYSHRQGERLPDVVLLDLHLPKVSGLEVLRRIKRDPRTADVRVVVLTISKNSADIAASEELGADTYIIKPVDFTNFSQATSQLKLQWVLMKEQKVRAQAYSAGPPHETVD